MAAVRLFEVPSSLDPYVGATLTRLGYLYDGVSFAFEGGFITAVPEDMDDELPSKGEVAQTIYREKIYQETLDMRKTLYRGIFGS